MGRTKKLKCECCEAEPAVFQHDGEGNLCEGCALNTLQCDFEEAEREYNEAKAALKKFERGERT